jgi:hypothetical protein
MRFHAALLPAFLLTTFCGISQTNTTPRVLEAKRMSGMIKIDGVLDDQAWKDAAVMTDLVEFRPKIGALEDPANRTISYLMYNDEGIYFGGFCHERTRDSISTELKGRDGYGANDYIGIIFDTYNDKLNGFEYFVTPLNEQWDAKMNPPSMMSDMEDFSWNAVWSSGAVITDSGWSFEMFIPFSAIRFGKKGCPGLGFQHNAQAPQDRATIYMEPDRSKRKRFSYAGSDLERAFKYQTAGAFAVLTLFFCICQSLSIQQS